MSMDGDKQIMDGDYDPILDDFIDTLSQEMSSQINTNRNVNTLNILDLLDTNELMRSNPSEKSSS